MDLSEYVREFWNDDGISIKDDSLGIDWRIPTENALLSEKDMKHELLKEKMDLGKMGFRELGNVGIPGILELWDFYIKQA